MEYDSESSCEGRFRDLESSNEHPCLKQTQKTDHSFCSSNSSPWQSSHGTAMQPNLRADVPNRSLSTQVLKYCQKYSQNSHLDQYFSLPPPSSALETVKCYYNISELHPETGLNRQDCIGQEYTLKSYVPRERRRWVRPPLIGQSSSTETSSRYVQPLTDPQSPSPDLKCIPTEIIQEEKDESHETLPESIERKVISPTSSITSHKPLEWDSGADVGYFNTLPSNKKNSKKLSTIERMALAGGCSAALRLDPEGTTESGVSGKTATIQSFKIIQFKGTTMVPNANSTPLLGNISGSESELEITPIVKNHVPGILTNSDVNSGEKHRVKDGKQEAIIQSSMKKEQCYDTSKSIFTFKIPSTKCLTEGRKVISKQGVHKDSVCPPPSLLKKSTSMNVLTSSPTKLILKRSQSELNLHAKDKNKIILPLIFNSTSSISTVVNKPTTCDKLIQTSLDACTQESVGIQVSDLQGDKPPLPKRGASLQKSLHSILKNPKGTYKVQNVKKLSKQCDESTSQNKEIKEIHRNKVQRSSSEVSRDGSTSVTPQPEENENVTGRANSFEYFPGHIYENVPNGSDSHVSSVDTGCSTSTLPNTSSSINEKLWGDSDSLVKDLERSVNILRTLVDANKCDKQVKKRLIHHVVKRLVTAKYTDDKIEHNLEDNVPWNPDDARRKVYRAEILQALTKKHSTTDSSDDWKPQKKNDCSQKVVDNNRSVIKGVTLGSSNSDKFDRNTDRTEMDGRKARMGLRTDDCQQSSNTTTDAEKSSECFFPQRTQKSTKAKNIFCVKDKCKLPYGESTTTNSIPPDRNRMLLDAVVHNRQTSINSTDNSERNVNWRMPTTLSERQYELRKCSNSDSGDSKLVSYAEMEKRNQLIWITNEITHLCNLKKLLEQPRKLERPKSSPRKSDKNFKHKPLNGLTYGNDIAYISRNTSDDIHRIPMNQQWSSHCNLATCEPILQDNSSNHCVRKRTSCAQTATANAGAQSKIGGEILSASPTYDRTVKSSSIGVQTAMPGTFALPSTMHTDVAKCTHKSFRRSSTKYNDPSVECQKCSNQVTRSACVHCLPKQTCEIAVQDCQETQTSADYYCKNDKQILTSEFVNSNGGESVDSNPCSKNASTQFKQKDTKNLINTEKSKCTCDRNVVPDLYHNTCQKCGSDYRYRADNICAKQSEHKASATNLCHMCSKQIVSSEINCITCGHEQSQRGHLLTRKSICICVPANANVEQCGCSTICECESGQINKDPRTTLTQQQNLYFQDTNEHVSSCNSQETSAQLCQGKNNCTCEKKEEPHSFHAICEYCARMKSQFNKISEIETQSKAGKQPTLPKHYCVTSSLGNVASGLQRIQNNSKCNCNKNCPSTSKVKDINDLVWDGKHNSIGNYTSKSSIDHYSSASKYCRSCGASYQSTKVCSCKLQYPKPVAYELSFTKAENKKKEILSSNILLKVPSSNFMLNTVKSSNCTSEIIKDGKCNNHSQRKITLQDYLSKNKPEFMGNAETRRQYMCEISHLRQLRKEKRMQLLVMASSSNILKSQSSLKATVCIQKKLSDEEMKERLRKRYLRLNEVRYKRRQQEKQEETRRNILMAKIFCKKLQQKVLRGQVDLSQSVSVISNL